MIPEEGRLPDLKTTVVSYCQGSYHSLGAACSPCSQVHQWTFKNNGIVFRDEDWSRLKKIGEPFCGTVDLLTL